MEVPTTNIWMTVERVCFYDRHGDLKISFVYYNLKIPQKQPKQRHQVCS